MARSVSSKRWLQEHASDHYVKEARARGFRSRAAFKLLEIQKRDAVLKAGQRVVDLGAAPGGWTQVVSELVGDTGKIVACDLLPMDPLPDVDFICGDFTEDAVLEEVMAALGNSPVDLVISDMAPNISGNKAIDQPRAMYLAELALEFAERNLKPGGDFLVKAFQGEGIETFRVQMRNSFRVLKTRKPDASRGRSREVYLLGRGYRGA